jgi:nucleoside-diphosphate-sugar epimerase
MILGIFGGTGFIGNTFLNKYHLCFDEVILFSNQNSVSYSNVKIVKIESSEFESEFSKCNLIVNAMFDHKYSKNISLLTYVLKLCNVYKIKKFIHISTISVYNLKLNLTINFYLLLRYYLFALH